MQSHTGNRYIMDLVNDYTNMPWSIPLKSKDEALTALQSWERARELETGERVGTYCTGDDSKLKNHQMEKWLDTTGTRQQLRAPYTLQHMGRVKHMHQTLQGKARTMRLAAKCPDSLWNEFYLTASHLHQKTPMKSLKRATPFQLWYGCILDYSYMREIGCRAFVLTQNQYNVKLNAHGVECVLIGYGHNSKTYRCYDRRTNKIYKSYHVQFLECHNGHNIEVDSNGAIRNACESTTISQIGNTASNMPSITIDDDEDTHTALPPIVTHTALSLIITHTDPASGEQMDAPITAELPTLRRSNHIPVPTQRAQPDDPQPHALTMQFKNHAKPRQGFEQPGLRNIKCHGVTNTIKSRQM